MNIWRGHVVRLADQFFLVRADMKEGRFGIDDQPKFWVKKAIDLESGEVKILKLAFHEEFAIATMRTALQALRQGAFDYIAKPFTRAELQGVVVRAARQAAQRGEAGENTSPPQEPDSDARHHLGGHCWIHVETDGTARIGLAQSFAGSVGRVSEVELPATRDFLEQGSVCLRLLTDDGRSHTVWSPLSGSVVEINVRLREDPQLAAEDPSCEGWLVRLDPTNLQDELKGLDLTRH